MPTKKEKQPLSVTHPELAKEADGWDPTIVSAGSGKKVKWICRKGHKFEAAVGNRSRKNGGNCPICGGKKVQIGYNDLHSVNPQLAKEASNWDPKTVTIGSHKKVEWICSNGHKYDAQVNNRVSGRGCPYCVNKKVLSGYNDVATIHPALAKEADGWDPSLVLAGGNYKLGWKCKFGHSFEAPFIARARGDNCPICSGHKLLIGFNDLKSTHPDISEEAYRWNPKSVSQGMNVKRQWKCQKGHIFSSTINNRTSGRGCPYCSGQKVLIGFNDLATTHPDLAEQLVDGDALTISKGTKKSFTWNCNLGHTWTASVGSRTNLGSNCPYCSGFAAWPGFNDLATTHPDLASEADGWDPTKISAGHNGKKSWKCKAGHRWKSLVSSRSTGVGCPSCALFGFNPDLDGYLYFLEHPDWEMLQIGITNFPDHRLNDHKKLGWEVLEIRGSMDGHLTRQWESAILRMLKAKGADLSNSKIAGKFSGYSEAWSKSTFEVKSIKELMRLTEEFEEK